MFPQSILCRMNTTNHLKSEAILTVSELTQSIKRILETEYRFIRLAGEISNLKTPFSGHSYFTLKDSGAQIRAVFFKQQQKFSSLTLQDGQQVVAFGRISVYEPRGEYQIIVDSVELYGIGRLQRQFEELKKKLAEQGYFAAELKKPLPAFPTKIIVISSPTGAAIQDFLKIVKIRKSPVHIQILPVKVQGKDAATEIAGAIRMSQNLPGADVIVLCRGGGSIEDLWAFNEEIVAEAIHRSSLPVVTGIGHEIDFTIADFCADFRCPTPTGAAERLIPDSDSLLRHIGTLKNSLVLRFQRKLTLLEQQVYHRARMLGEMKNVLKNIEFRLQLSTSYLIQAMTRSVTEKEQHLRSLLGRLQLQKPSSRIELYGQQLNMLMAQLNNHIQRIVERKEAALAEQATLLNSVSPLATLGRGYAIVRRKHPEDGSYLVVSRADDADLGEELNILFHEGQLWCVVTDKE
jgi:exodeoxyribonuclease VII large subunit